MEKFNYELLQVKTELAREVGHMPLAWLQDYGIEVAMENYKSVYEGELTKEIPVEVLENNFHVLELLFHKFNMDHPADYVGRSMSVSDIVKLNDLYYYCDSYGFKEMQLTDGIFTATTKES